MLCIPCILYIYHEDKTYYTYFTNWVRNGCNFAPVCLQRGQCQDKAVAVSRNGTEPQSSPMLLDGATPADSGGQLSARNAGTLARYLRHSSERSGRYYKEGEESESESSSPSDRDQVECGHRM